MWCKQALFETVTRTPLIFRVPWLTSAVGVHVSEPVGLVDVFHTLVQLAGLPATDTQHGFWCVQGRALFDPALPEQEAAEGVVSQFPRCASRYRNPWSNPCMHETARSFRDMGYSLRTAQWRYTTWRPWLGIAANWSDGASLGEELYQHPGDAEPWTVDQLENTNLAHDARFAGVRAQLAAALRERVTNPAFSVGCAKSPAQAPAAPPTDFPTWRDTAMPTAAPSQLAAPTRSPSRTRTRSPEQPTSRPTHKPRTLSPRGTSAPTSRAPALLTRSPALLTRSPTLLTRSPSLLTRSPSLLTPSPTRLTPSPAHLTPSPARLTPAPSPPPRSRAPTPGAASLVPTSAEEGFCGALTAFGRHACVSAQQGAWVCEWFPANLTCAPCAAHPPEVGPGCLRV